MKKYADSFGSLNVYEVLSVDEQIDKHTTPCLVCIKPTQNPYLPIYATTLNPDGTRSVFKKECIPLDNTEVINSWNEFYNSHVGRCFDDQGNLVVD